MGPDMALATPDPSMEDILPSPVMLLQPLLLDTLDLDTQEPSMEDMVATMAKETLKLSQRLRLMPPMVLMEDMVLDTPAMLLLLLLAMLLQLFPDQLLPAMLLQLLPAMLLQLLPAMPPAVAAYAAPTVAAPVISRPAIASYAAPAIATGYAGIARPAISSYAGYGYGRLY